MENSGYEADAEKSMELSEVKTISGQLTNTNCHSQNNIEKGKKSEGQEKPLSNSCNMDMCRDMHAKYLQDKRKIVANPWHRLKTLFLVGIIVILGVWLLVYILFSWLEVL